MYTVIQTRHVTLYEVWLPFKKISRYSRWLNFKNKLSHEDNIDGNMSQNDKEFSINAKNEPGNKN